MLIGIICRYQNKENNYIYSLDEMAEYDFGLLQDCISDPDDFHISYTLNKGDRCEGLLLRDTQDIKNFINGKFNSDNIIKNERLLRTSECVCRKSLYYQPSGRYSHC